MYMCCALFPLQRQTKKDKCCGLRPAAATAIRILCQCVYICIFKCMRVCVCTRWD